MKGKMLTLKKRAGNMDDSQAGRNNVTSPIMTAFKRILWNVIKTEFKRTHWQFYRLGHHLLS